jgi:hypothetical protein
VSKIWRAHLHLILNGNKRLRGDHEAPWRVARRVDRQLADHCRFNNSFSPQPTGPSPPVLQMLAAEPSAELPDRLIAELNDLGSNDGAAMWAHRRLIEKNKLAAADAQQVEDALTWWLKVRINTMVKARVCGLRHPMPIESDPRPTAESAESQRVQDPSERSMSLACFLGRQK